MVNKEIKKTLFKDIYKVIGEIKKCHFKSKYNDYNKELYMLYYLCDKLGIDDFPKLDEFSYKSYESNEQKELEKYMHQLLDDQEYHFKFSENAKNVDKYKKLDNHNFDIKSKLNLSDCLVFMEDFLKQYDIKLYELFLKLNNENRIIVCNMDSDDELRIPAFTIASYGSFTPYILLELEDNVIDTLCIVHELVHVYDYMQVKSSKVNVQKHINCLSEVPSCFLQFAYIDYLEKTKCFKEDIQNLYYSYSFPYIEYIDKIKEEYQNVNFYELYRSRIDEYLDYSYGIAIALHFLERYKIDPIKTKKEINDFILLDGQYNMMEMLEKFNLKSEIINSKVLKKYV